MTTGTILPSHRYPQHGLEGDVTLPDGKVLPKPDWENNCCGLACIQTVLELEGLPVPSLEQLSIEGIEGGAYRDDRGWIFQGLLNLGRRHGLDGIVIPDAPIDSVESLPNLGVAPIVSVSCGFPHHPDSKGGHLVVLRGLRTNSRGRNTCVFDDPSTQGARISEIDAPRFWSSFSGRTLLMKEARAWQSLSGRIADNARNDKS